ncbi:unnamed protein product [Rhodiola kirilowii]
MPQQSILVVELFDVWGIDFLGYISLVWNPPNGY